jgi:hypothetical protein
VIQGDHLEAVQRLTTTLFQVKMSSKEESTSTVANIINDVELELCSTLVFL